MAWDPRAGGPVRAPSHHPPTPPASLVSRPRLTGLLDRAVALTLVVAPAGSGKTVLAADWVHARRASGQPVLWVIATDAGTLLPALASAAGVPAEALDEVRRTYDEAPDEVAETLRAHATPGTQPAPIVIDDAHHLPPDSVGLLGRLLATAPELLRLVLLTRRDLPLPLVPLDLAGQLVMVRAGQLCFDDDDAGDLVRSHAPRATAADVTQLQEHTKGWAAALILAARALDAADDPPDRPPDDAVHGAAGAGLPAERVPRGPLRGHPAGARRDLPRDRRDGRVRRGPVGAPRCR
ncbi:AAA family ATPase [Nocardioides sp.]|uniref:AAA family ATPase n=1 Tax=Nocardioides sp. TaxID=35761 RepID=UPI0035B3B43D